MKIVLIRFLSVIIFCLGLVACTSYHAKAPVKDINIHHVGRSVYHRVKRGETLYAVAWRYNKDYRALARLNQLKSPYHIYPGQHIYLRRLATSHHKRKDIKRKQVKHTTHHVKKSHRHPMLHSRKKRVYQIKQRHKINKKSVQKKRIYHKKHYYHATLKWVWPAKGRVNRSFSSSNKGIDISGVYNEPIYAAASGIVVYAGNGIRDFKNLILVKHNELYITAYAHNTAILVKEGQRVRAGQTIARMGSALDGRIILHFEIRRAGKSVNPLFYVRPR